MERVIKFWKKIRFFKGLSFFVPDENEKMTNGEKETKKLAEPRTNKIQANVFLSHHCWQTGPLVFIIVDTFMKNTTGNIEVKSV